MLQQRITLEKVQTKIDQMLLKNAKLVKTNKVLPPLQADNRTSKGSDIQFLCEFCSKKYKLHSGLKRHQKNCA